MFIFYTSNLQPSNFLHFPYFPPYHSRVQFWKFAITGGDNNREVKIWSCESWSCLQTLTFNSPPDLPSNFQVDPCLKAAIDLSANYLCLSDIKRKVGVYLLGCFY